MTERVEGFGSRYICEIRGGSPENLQKKAIEQEKRLSKHIIDKETGELITRASFEKRVSRRSRYLLQNNSKKILSIL